jgi:hypothetical protein
VLGMGTCRAEMSDKQTILFTLDSGRPSVTSATNNSAGDGYSAKVPSATE